MTAPERKVRLVLAGPRDGRNVGSVCRAMKTMGLRDLSIVAGDFDPSDARAAAVHAADVFDAASRPDTLQEAIADCDEAIAISRRRGKRRKQAPMPLSDSGRASGRPRSGHSRRWFSAPRRRACVTRSSPAAPACCPSPPIPTSPP